MNFIVSTLGRGGFVSEVRAVYALLLNQYLYVGVTGTSNRTGTSRPHERLGTHVKKRKKNWSAIWDNIFAQGLVSPESLAVRMLSVFVEPPCDADVIEKAAITLLQQRLEPGILRNSLAKTLPPQITAEERQFANNFVDAVLEERIVWIDSNFSEGAAIDVVKAALE